MIAYWFQRIFFIVYKPDPSRTSFQERAQVQTASKVEVTVSVPDAKESERLFGVPLARKGLQPIHLRIVNRSAVSLRLHFRSLDPNYFPPLEAASLCHFSILKRLYTFGIFAWYFLPFLFLAPFKFWGIHRANRRMDALFQQQAFHRRPIAQGETSEGFVFVAYSAGTKMVPVRLIAIEGIGLVNVDTLQDAMRRAPEQVADAVVETMPGSFVDLMFSISVPGINADYLHKKLDALVPADADSDCNLPTLVKRLSEVSATTSNRRNTGSGDPINLVVIGSFETLLNAFVGRWDETEVISLSTCWKTARAFLLGSEYRYSPVSSLYLFGRSQDIALQQIRQSISERLHLRLWLAPMTFRKQPVWIGQVSRDIGVRFTTAAWNLTTHRIDPDVDESRDYVLEDLLDAERVLAAGYVFANAASTATTPHRNLTGDPYYTDGRRVVIQLSDERTTPRFVAWT
jgi:hypothetical protein